MSVPSASSAQSMGPTLRSLLDARRVEGRRMSIEEAIGVIVPVCMDLQARHARGERLYVHPSAIAAGADGLARLDARLAVMPTLAADRPCLAPELQRTLEPGDACSSVFSVGAILYEMVTGQPIGPAMKRPSRDQPDGASRSKCSSSGHRGPRPSALGPRGARQRHVPGRASKERPPARRERVAAGRERELEVDIRFSMLPQGEANYTRPRRRERAPTTRG